MSRPSRPPTSSNSQTSAPAPHPPLHTSPKTNPAILPHTLIRREDPVWSSAIIRSSKVDHNQFKEEMAHIDNLMTLWTNSTSQRPEIENNMRQMGFTVRVDAAEDTESNQCHLQQSILQLPDRNTSGNKPGRHQRRPSTSGRNSCRLV